MAHCWTQQDVAAAWSRRFIGRPPESKEISRWEVWPGRSGVRPSLDTLDKLAQLYECSISDLLIDISDYRDRDVLNRSARRQAYRTAVVHAADPPGATRSTAEAFPLAGAAQTEAHQAAGAGPLDVTAIRAMSDAFRTADRRVGGGALYGAVTRYLNAEVGPLLLASTSHGLDTEVFTAAASLTEAAGWMAHDGGSDDVARRHFTRAFKLASVADSAPLIANVCASMSHLASQLGEHDDAVRLADKGLEQTAQAPAGGQLVARLHAMRAVPLAWRRDARACLQELGQAEDALGAPDAQDPGWVSHFDEASLAIETALCLRHLGDSRGAEAHALRAIHLRSGDRVRSRTFARIALARVLLDAGRVDEAATIGVEVCDVAATLASTRVVGQLDDLMVDLANHRQLHEVAEFRAALEELHQSDDSPTQPSAWPT
jgi:transcriptional regulator with XRE-family HTH domain